MGREEMSPVGPASFSGVLRAALKERGMSLRAVHSLLADRGSPVSVTTLSSWGTGTRHPEGPRSVAAVEELERLLLLPPGTLVDLLRASKRPGQVGRLGAAFAEDRERVFDEITTDLGADPQTALREIWASVVATVNAAGGVATYRCRSLLQATTGSVRSIPIIVVLPDGVEDLPVIRAVGGGSVGRSLTHASRTMMGARFDLEYELNAPESTMVEFEIRFSDAFPADREVGYGTKRRARELSIWVQFEQGAAPEWVREFEDSSEGFVEAEPRPIAGKSVHARRANWGPGYFGLRWGAGAPDGGVPVPPGELE